MEVEQGRRDGGREEGREKENGTSTYLIVVVLHDFPVEGAVLGPSEVVFDCVPIDAGVDQTLLTVKWAVLGVPGDFRLGICVEIDVDEPIAVDVDVDGEESNGGWVECRY